ncbi:hypothetical protein [Mycobacterium neglectum]|uniref:hypothetical protein n=1 Tax=Mycobacterium neglectum TaxID=242737 RepID=UPI001145B7D0|nr:hypothetical protein [Mycobacterium neglectum]
MRRISRSFVAVVCMVAAAAIGPVGPAVGQPPGDAPPVITIGWQQLGINPQVALVGDDMTQKIVIPVPEGLQPIAMTGVIESVSNIPSGVIQAQTTDGRPVGAIPIPILAAGQPPVGFSLDIASAPVVRREIQLNLILQVDADTVCRPIPMLVMGNISVSYAGGAQSPQTIEQFLPVIAPVVDLYVDPAPTDAEKITTLRLVAAVSKYYQPAKVTMNVRPLPRTAPGPPPDRDGAARGIVIRDVDEPKPGVQLVTDAGGPFLVFTGRGEALARQAGLFRDDLQKLAQANSFAIESAASETDEKTAKATFGELLLGGSTTVLGENYIYLSLARALAAATKPGIVDVHLLANYTPLDEDEKGTMIVAVGDLVLTTVRLDASGRVDSNFSIPADLAARNQDVTVTVRYEPGPGCTPLTLPMNFDIDPMSTAIVRRGGEVSMGGFSALPQGFIPKFQVAFDGSDPDELAHAATIIELIQRLSSTAMLPELVSLEQAAQSDTSALIIASAESVQRNDLDPPIAPQGDNLSQVDLPSSTVIDIDTGLAALQSYAQNNRTVVLLTASGPWTLAAPLFGYVAGLPEGWRELTGDVLVVGQGADPQNFTVRSDGPTMAGVPSPADVDVHQDSRGWYEWTLLGAGVLVVLAVIGGAIALLRRRSRPIASAETQP